MPYNDHLVSQGHFLHYNHATDGQYSFVDDSASACALVPSFNLSPADFETSVPYHSPSSSPSDSLPSSPLYEPQYNLPSTPPKKPATRLRSGNRVPRPRNAFMIFRSEFWANAKISKTVEHDHRHISRIIGHCWNELPEHKKAEWRQRAEQEKIEHSIKYPGYRFTPNVRTKQIVKRNVKRNGEDEMLRCKEVAKLLLGGKTGHELDQAVECMDKTLRRRSPASGSKEISDPVLDQTEPVFDSPLLPPAETNNNIPVHQYVANENIHGSQTCNNQPVDSCGQTWPVQYPAMSSVANHQTASYSVSHYTSEQNAASLSHGYDYTDYYPESQNQHSHLIVSSNVYPRSSAFQIEFVDPYEYHGLHG